jgi:hypothetical protein
LAVLAVVPVMVAMVAMRHAVQVPRAGAGVAMGHGLRGGLRRGEGGALRRTLRPTVGHLRLCGDGQAGQRDRGQGEVQLHVVSFGVASLLRCWGRASDQGCTAVPHHNAAHGRRAHAAAVKGL